MRSLHVPMKNVQNVVTYIAIISANNDRGELLPGMTANVRITTDSRESVLKAPNSALRFRPPGEAPTDAKAACLYPNGARASAFAATQGADNAVMCDAMGHVAEFASANLWFAKDGKVVTPAVNHTFLNGITRQRIIGLFKDAGVAVEERAVKPAELETADEIFSTGNYAKVQPCTRYNGRDMQIGRFATQAREMYWRWMEAQPKLV